MEEKNMEVKDEKISNETAQEIMVAMMERQVKRLFILCIIIFVAFVGSNIGWLVYESQFEDIVSSQTITQDSGEGGTNTYTGDFIGGDYNGKTDDKNNGENTP